MSDPFQAISNPRVVVFIETDLHDGSPYGTGALTSRLNRQLEGTGVVAVVLPCEARVAAVTDLSPVLPESVVVPE